MHEIIELKNGLRVVIENITHVKSISVGVWVGAGSYAETRANNGISHFIEHMMFKGTKKRTPKEIAEAIDDIGGQLNAFTSRDCTCYYAKVLSDHLDTAVDVLSDMLFNSLYDVNDISLEKGVVLEEINMYNDSPDELVHDLLMEKVWQGNSLGYSILGTSKSLKKITRDDILSYIENYYTPQNSIISVVGNFDRANLLSLINDAFGNWENNGVVKKSPNTPRFTVGRDEITKDIEQTHLCVGYDALSRGHQLLYPLMVVNTVLGSGMSSRLFQKIREEKGLVYSIYSYQSVFAKAGLFTIYAGMNPARLDEVSQLIFKEIDELKKNGLSEHEVAKSKEQLKGSLILGLESTSSRMNSYGQSLLLIDKIRTIDEMIEKIDSVNVDNVKQVIDLVFTQPAIAIVQKAPNI